MEQTIIRLAIGLVLLVAVNVVLGSLNALFDGTFDRIKCRNGVIKGVIIAACFVAPVSHYGTLAFLFVVF